VNVLKKQSPKSVEQWYPHPKGRNAADAAVDALDPMTTTISQALDVWDQTYFDVAGSSPFRKTKR
jgi:hypothetical protein